VVVLAGRPNTGKSSLFNALLGQDRAIVTEEPGTTRDALEAVVSMGGFPFRLVDTAGIRETEGRVERLGIEVAWRYLKGADVILLCVEGKRSLAEEEVKFLEQVSGTPVVLVRTKADLVSGLDRSGEVSTGVFEVESRESEAGSSRGSDHAASPGVGSCGVGEDSLASEVAVSVVSGLGLDGIRDLLPSLVYGGLVKQDADVPVLTRERHTRALRFALEELRRFREGLERGLPAEVAATHLRPAETELEELLGVIPREEILDRLFREFCIGK
jgi:tRNA modification GTPase